MYRISWARAVAVSLTQPVTLFAGQNGAGKSSLQEAVRMALTGEAGRVSLKKDYGQLVTKGAESGFAEVEIDGAVRACVTLPGGKTTPLTKYVPPTALPYVLDAQRFAQLDPNERRAFLFGLMGLSASGAQVKQRLLAKGCNEQQVETLMPMLRAGFDAAHQEAQARARDEKAAWRALTGETYGDKKAATWAADKLVFDAAALASLQQKLAATDAGLAAAHQRMGVLRADHKRYTETAQRLITLREKGSRTTRITDKLAHDEAELKQWEAKVEETRQRATGGRKAGLVHDLAHALHGMINEPQPKGYDRRAYLTATDAMARYVAEHGEMTDAAGHDPQAAARLPAYEQALRMLQNAVANDRRDLAEAEAAAKALAELEAAIGTAPDEADIHAARQHLADLKAERATLAKKLADLQHVERQAKQADERTAQALAAHASVLAWVAIANALAPDGIPGEMLAKVLTPLITAWRNQHRIPSGCASTSSQICRLGLPIRRRPCALTRCCLSLSSGAPTRCWLRLSPRSPRLSCWCLTASMCSTSKAAKTWLRGSTSWLRKARSTPP